MDDLQYIFIDAVYHIKIAWKNMSCLLHWKTVNIYQYCNMSEASEIRALIQYKDVVLPV